MAKVDVTLVENVTNYCLDSNKIHTEIDIKRSKTH